MQSREEDSSPGGGGFYFRGDARQVGVSACTAEAGLQSGLIINRRVEQGVRSSLPSLPLALDARLFRSKRAAELGWDPSQDPA